MYRLLALAYHHERFALPTVHAEKAISPYVHQGFTGFVEKMPRKEWHPGSR
jgi:nitrate reductase beta subunit